MKKKLLLTLIMLLFPLGVFASTNTTPRTEDDLRVDSWVTVTDDNKNNILSTPSVNAEEKVYDFANLYTDAEEKEIYNRILKFIDERKLDLVVVTIDKNPKGSAMVYADDFYDYNSFGLNETRDGVLFLVDMDTRELWISGTGYGKNKYYDEKINMILDKTFQDFSDKKYYEGTLNVIKTMDSYYDLEYNGYEEYESKTYTDYLKEILIATGIVTIIVMLILVSKNKMVNVATSSREYLDKGTKQVKLVKNQLIDRHVTKTEIVHYDSDNHHSSGGGFSGGGGHISSSGSFHSGGGHRF